ncbi:protein-glutamine gamma-glutamyltransferase K-like [Mya arenaria]|uniref:protein-glutamine gamma-glutamyltransferase K-like n=1 Tax=Mya arenaria TaxID=6604 RepID=UPI0022DF79E7|nr:protein-glutamine gamma-glutamyltransferase K-like [Mya arenaria]
MGRRSRGNAENPPKRTRNRYNLRSESSRAKRDAALGGTDGRRVEITDDEFRENSAALAVVTEGKALTVSSVDLQKETNRAVHHTEEFEQEELVVRRGQPITFKIIFDRNVKTDSDLLFAKFAYGSRPQESKGTLIRLPLNLNGDASTADNWNVKVKDVDKKVLTLTVCSEADSMIGKYELMFETKVKGSENDFANQDLDTFFYLLFNPWCKDDAVYMESEEQRNEYVLNDTGYIWTGNLRMHSARAWNFGQFESPVLEVALTLLDKGELADSGRSSVISVIRCLSALTNSNDDEGLLYGKWGSEYPKPGTKPWEWTGSVAIMEQYHTTGKPVKYGQCWVFSGVVTTLLRCLGIPTRSVTNFESAHDTDCSMTIDKHFNEDGEPIEELNDSTWNFHVWNESYFKRLDLPEGYDGWQAHDATPQELSEGVMRCGPAPIKAIKEGHVYLNFDTGFIFSEVNGDKIEWEVKKDGSMEVVWIDKYAVGANISTKAVGSSERHDLTLDYKYREGSAEERKVVEFVERFSSRRKQNIYKKAIGDKEIDYELILADDSMIGDDLEVGVKVKNLTSGTAKINVTLTMASMFYTGVAGKKIKGDRNEIELASGEEKEVKMPVSAEEYEVAVNPEFMYKVTAACRVIESGRLYASIEAFSLRKPPLVFDVGEKICSSVETIVPLTFKNTTNLKLHSAVFHVEGSYMVKARAFHIRKLIHPDDEITVDVPFYPRRLGNRTVSATFSAEEIANVEGVVNVFVVSKSEWKDESEEEKESAEPITTDETDSKPISSEEGESGGDGEAEPAVIDKEEKPMETGDGVGAGDAPDLEDQPGEQTGDVANGTD